MGKKVWALAEMNNTLNKVIERYMIQTERKIWMTLQQSQMNIFDYTEDDATSSQVDFLAKPLVSQGIAEGLTIQEEQSSFTLRGRLKKSNHLMFYWKTSKAYYHTTKGELLEQSFKRWMNWGMSQNGVCLTLNTGEFHRTENVCIS